MKSTTAQLRAIAPVSRHTFLRYPESDPTFPRPEKIGREAYFDENAFHDWLSSRASNPDAMKKGDKLLTVEQVCDLLGRSSAWVYLNIIKPSNLCTFDLSPSGKSKNPRRYFIEREVKEAFRPLVELQEAA